MAELSEKLQLKRGFDVQKAVETTDELRAFSKVIVIPRALKTIAAEPDDDVFWSVPSSERPNILSVVTGIFLHSGTTKGSAFLEPPSS